MEGSKKLGGDVTNYEKPEKEKQFLLLKFMDYSSGECRLTDAIVVEASGGASFPVATTGDPYGDKLECWVEVIK